MFCSSVVQVAEACCRCIYAEEDECQRAASRDDLQTVDGVRDPVAASDAPSGVLVQQTHSVPELACNAVVM